MKWIYIRHPVLLIILTALTQFKKHLILLPCYVFLCPNMNSLQELSQLIRVCILLMLPTQMDLSTFWLLTFLMMLRMLGMIQSGVECHDATKGLRESFFKALVVFDRLSTCCQVKYRLELYKIPWGRKASNVMEKSPSFVSPLQKYLINVVIL